MLGDCGQGRGQIGLDEPVALAQRSAVGFAKIFVEDGQRARRSCALRQRIGAVVGDFKPSRASVIAGLRRSGEGEFARAVFVERQREPRDGAGHADAERGIARLRRVGRAVCAEEDVASNRIGRGLAIVDGDVASGIGEMNHHEPAAADVSGARIGDRQGEAGRDRCIDRIAALREHIRARSWLRAAPAPPPCRVSAATGRAASEVAAGSRAARILRDGGP